MRASRLCPGPHQSRPGLAVVDAGGTRCRQGPPTPQEGNGRQPGRRAAEIHGKQRWGCRRERGEPRPDGGPDPRTVSGGIARREQQGEIVRVGSGDEVQRRREGLCGVGGTVAPCRSGRERRRDRGRH